MRIFFFLLAVELTHVLVPVDAAAAEAATSGTGTVPAPVTTRPTSTTEPSAEPILRPWFLPVTEESTTQQPQPVPLSPLRPEAQQPAPGVPWRPVETGPVQRVGEFVDVVHGGISHTLLSTAEWLDSFFMDDRSVHEENRTYVLLRYDLFKEESADFKRLPSFNLRLNLPQMQHKTQFVFSAEPKGEPTPVAGTTTPVSPATERPGTTTPDRNLTAAVHYLFRSTVEESASIKVGSLLSSGSPVLFASPRYRASKAFKPWDFRFTEEMTWRTDNGWESDTAFDLERPLPHELFFRTTASGVWRENTKGYYYNLGASVRQPFGLEHAVNYEWVSSYRTEPSNELTEIAFRIRYRHSFLRQWIFFEVAPQYRFPRDKNFNGFAGILFRIESFFGVNP